MFPHAKIPVLRKLRWALAVFVTALAATIHGQSLRIDFNDRSNDLPINTHEHFDANVIAATGGSTAIQTAITSLSYGSVTISISDLLSIGYDDRKRSTPVNSGGFTEAQLLQDFVFSTGTNPTNGLNVRIQGLTPNQLHTITIWSFDAGNTVAGNHVSDWFANGVLVKDNYTFDKANLPTSNSQYRFSFNATSSPSGEIIIQGKGDVSSVAPAVFLNALEISPIPDQIPPCNTATHFQPGSNLYGWTGGYTFEEQDQEIAALKEAGAKWARINAVWYAVEPNQKGVYDSSLLSLYDHLMAKLAENGMKAIFVTADTPYWASADPSKTNGNWSQKYRPTNNSDLADYFVFLLNRYRSTGPHAFEIWNEENVSNFWPSGVDATNYFSMLQTCYTAIKAADPQAIVLNGGLTDGSNTTNYMASLYAAGAKNYFDAWSQHTYTRTPQYETVMPKIRKIMTDNGDDAKKIWVTECGWVTYTNTADPSAVSYNRQAHYLTNLFTRLASYPYVEVGLWYTSRSYDETQHEGSFGLMLPDFTKKPSFYAFKDWTMAANKMCPPDTLRLSEITRLPSGVMRLGVNATTGLTYTVQATSIPMTNWQTIATNVTGGTNSFDDLQSTNYERRFYRLLWP